MFTAPANDAQARDLSEVTIVIVTFNSAHCIKALGESLAACPKIIVTDNGSQDDTVPLLRHHCPQARVVELGRNLGFGAANNRALDLIETPYALLLNPDCRLSTNQIAGLLKWSSRFPDAAIIAPQLVAKDGTPEINYRWPSTVWHSRGPGASGPACVGFICGASMLLNLAQMGRNCRFDERFFLYYEDDDLCLRLFKDYRPMIVVPELTAVHQSRGSVRGRSRLLAEYWRGFHHVQSKILFTQKHLGSALASQQKAKLMVITFITLPLRVLSPPRLFARHLGRLIGLMRLSVEMISTRSP